MTVQELIDHLKRFPPDVVVLYRYASDWSELAADKVRLTTPEDEDKIAYRSGAYCEGYKREWYPPGEEPVYITAVTFPGN